MKVNANGIERSASYINKSKKYFKEAYNTINNAKPPSDFKYSSKLKSIPGKISEILEDVSGVEKWMSLTINKLKKAERKNMQMLGLLSNVNINLFDANDRTEVTPLSQYKVYDLKQAASEVEEKDRQKEQQSKSILEMTIPEILTKTVIGASVSNLSLGAVKGVANIGEYTVDFGTILGTGVASVFTGAYDGISYLMNNKDKEWKSATEKMWKGTMGFVSTEHVENAFKDFYQKTEVGKLLEKNAGEGFKSNGIATNIASGLGNVAGILATGGISGIATPIIATISGTGKYTEESWANMRDAASSGEDWKTPANALKGILYGGTNGLWEGAQWLVGGKLSKWGGFESSRLATSGVRTGIDTAFNALDTPFRTLTQALANGDNIGKVWKEQGGWSSVLTSVGVGLIGSIGGEILDFKTALSKQKIHNSIGNGKAVTLTAESLEEIPTDFWSNIDEKANITLKIKGQEYSYNDFLNLDDQDTVALLKNIGFEDFKSGAVWGAEKWNKQQLSDMLHYYFGDCFGHENINSVLDEIQQIPPNQWKKSLLEHNLDESVVGFADKKNIYLPEDATQHTAVHEAFHKISDLSNRNMIVRNAEGQARRITGIREFFSDGTDSTMANETLTEYLTSKYTDGFIHDSIYGKSNISFWDRIDTAIQNTSYSNNGDFLMNAYIFNEPDKIRSFFNDYAYQGAYDQFRMDLDNWIYKQKDIDKIVSTIEKSVYKENHPILGLIKSIFSRR